MTIQEYLMGAGMEFWRHPAMLILMAAAEWLCFLYYVRVSENTEHHFLINAGFAGAYIGLQMMHNQVALHCLVSLALWYAYICWKVPDANWKNILLGSGIFCLYIEFAKLVCRDGALAYQVKRLFPEISDQLLNGGMVVLYLLFLWLGVWWVRRQLVYLRNLELNIWHLVSQIMPLGSYILVRQYQFRFMDTMTNVGWLWLDALQLLIVVCAEFTIVTTIRMLSVEKEKAELVKREMLFEKQQEQYRIQQATIEAVNRRYHDLKHYLAVLETLGSNNKRHGRAVESENKKEQKYLREKYSMDEHIQALRREIEPYECIQKTGNEILDILLAERIAECQKKNIRLVPVVDGRSTRFISTMDLCSVFGNAMDNAIEATMGLTYVNMREISVKIGVSQQMLLMRFQNYFEGELLREGERIVTSKPDREGHGYGLQNIETIVGRYGGTVACETEGQEFSLHILIPLPEK